MEAIVGRAVGFGDVVQRSLLTRSLGVPRLTCSVACGGLVGPIGGLLLLRCLRSGSHRVVHLLVGPGDDLVALLQSSFVGTASGVPALGGNISLGLNSRSSAFGRGGSKTVGLGLLELGQTSVGGSRVGSGGLLNGSGLGVGVLGGERCVVD